MVFNATAVYYPNKEVAGTTWSNGRTEIIGKRRTVTTAIVSAVLQVQRYAGT